MSEPPPQRTAIDTDTPDQNPDWLQPVTKDDSCSYNQQPPGLGLQMPYKLSLETESLRQPPPPPTNLTIATIVSKMPPRKKRRTQPTKPAKTTTKTTTTSSYSRSRSSYNPSKHSLASLPYHILISILTHAATTPGTLHGWPNTSFLLSCATLCRTLHDPAVAVLYCNPPTFPPARAHRLLQTLRERPELGQKIKRLVVEVDPLLTTKLGGRAWDVCEFVLLARGLRDLQFAHEVDRPPYREESRMRFGWRYPDALWGALEGKKPAVDGGDGVRMEVEGLRLKSWKWSGKFIGRQSFAEIGRIHELRSLSTLTSISLIYIDTIHDNSGMVNGSVENYVAKLISSLPELRDIKLECCSIVNPKLLSLLSTSALHLKLRKLRLLNCPFLEDSDPADGVGLGLTSFLQQPPCRSLKVLEIQSCQSCSLKFITALSSIPMLEHLSFDAHIFNPLFPNVRYLTPYTTLLPLSDSEVIHWPPTLQSLTASSLRQWSSAECIAFLRSLVDAAPTMPRLSHIEIWCMLTDIDWRQRAEFREKWYDVIGAAFGKAEKVEVRFDNARPAEQLWKETDFLQEGAVLGRVRTRAAARRRAGARAGRNNRGRAGGAGSNESEGDEDYNDD